MRQYQIPATKVSELDEQHEEIFSSIKKLINACAKGGNDGEIARAAALIKHQVNAHFKMEEEYMIDCNYPGYEDHKAEHQKFMKGFANISRQVETAGPDRNTIIEMNLLVANWLADHIARMDAVLGTFLRSSIARGKGSGATVHRPGRHSHRNT